MAFFSDAQWSPDDRDEIMRHDLTGFNAVLERYGLSRGGPSLAQRRLAGNRTAQEGPLFLGEFVDKIQPLLEGERTPNRTFIHELLGQYQFRHPAYERLSALTEEVTMGTMSWEAYRAVASVALAELQEGAPIAPEGRS